MATTEFSVADLVKAMDSASDEIKEQVVGLIDTAAVVFQHRVQQAYEIGPTGNLRDRVVITRPRVQTFTASGVKVPAKQVRATAPHVHIYQEGTVERFDATRANARRGRSPAHGRIFERTAVDVRRDMLEKAQRVLDKNRELV